jgi:hypothetical protein
MQARRQITMMITRTSQASGVTRTLDIPCTQEQLDAWKSGTLIQRAMPQLTPDQREFLMTGITGEEWDQMFASNEDVGTSEE